MGGIALTAPAWSATPATQAACGLAADNPWTSNGQLHAQARRGPSCTRSTNQTIQLNKDIGNWPDEVLAEKTRVLTNTAGLVATGVCEETSYLYYSYAYNNVGQTTEGNHILAC